MMMMMRRVMCVLAVVLCCACGYTMTAAAAVDNDSPSGRGVSRGAVEVSCGAGGALRVRPAAESEWLTCGAGSRVSACGKYADLCRQRTATRAATTRTTIATTAGQPKAVMANGDSRDSVDRSSGIRLHDDWEGFPLLSGSDRDKRVKDECTKDSNPEGEVEGRKCSVWLKSQKVEEEMKRVQSSGDHVGSEVEERRSDAQGVQVQRPAGEIPHQDSVSSDRRVGTLSSPEDPSAPQGSSGTSSLSDTTITAAREVSASSVETPTVTSTKLQTQGSTAESSTTSPASTNESTGNSTSGADTANNSTPDNSNATQQSPATVLDATAADSEETNSTTPPSTENTTTEAPSTTLSPVLVTDPQIGNVVSTVQKKANVDSSISPVWMRTAAPLLIVAVFVSATVY
ncbi:uncharacterized protein TM35_000581100 [Trypanosoma theileri]|uniref:Mucin-like glycoprotein n=1 Tax=Trypanosoma theileri TaxID=67003 RepID=A0A1X0NGE8_9TRYP|nr:uncharacterized protein TM35_000581100 [Trypanosoma theileri]ORC83747.1 hypothetical protein TM35_000581100 [Trypanosoma theileri]